MRASPIIRLRLAASALAMTAGKVAMALAGSVALGTLVFAADTQISASADRPSWATASAGVEQWRVIESVLTHPRCMNCHTVTDYPRQGDDRHRHQYRVVRGPMDRGVPSAMCTACHQGGNNASSGVPGAPNWRLAPLSMSFEQAPGKAMSGRALCQRLLDKKRNGNLAVSGLELHLAQESLVQWAWSPGTLKDGTPRGMPTVSQEELSDAFKAWAASGAPCPK
jgi:hypothetical protein